MSCGVPVITTPSTCGPDVMEDGREGFIIPIRDSEALAAKLEWAVSNRRDLAEMGVAAGKAADKFTWPAFRQGIRNAYKAMLVGSARPRISANRKYMTTAQLSYALTNALTVPSVVPFVRAGIRLHRR